MGATSSAARGDPRDRKPKPQPAEVQPELTGIRGLPPLHHPIVEMLQHTTSPLSVTLITWGASRYTMRDTICGIVSAKLMHLNQPWKRAVAGSALALAVPAVPFVAHTLVFGRPTLSSLYDFWLLPVGYARRSLTALHEATGLPWWATFAVATIGLRLATIPLNFYMMRNVLRLKERRSEVTQISSRIQDCTQPLPLQQQAASELQALLSEVRSGPGKDLIVPLVFPPVFLSLFGGIHSLCAHEPTLTQDGALWFVDLSVADVTGILPVVSSLTWLLNMELGVGAAYVESGQFRTAMRALALAFIPVVSPVPSGVFCFWITSNEWEAANLVQAGRGTARIRVPAAEGYATPLTTQLVIGAFHTACIGSIGIAV
ncbi:60Kd inner membrane protein-domain-containing protein [Pavlovales sp. CCMP2436]|nr:60Kd inner membrane protein-domain-containing protein [Pavlovales sp. CCMP2436]